MLNKGLLGRQTHDNGNTPIVSSDGDGLIMEHGIHEGFHLRDIALGVALDEEVER
jgi:hypothetical protein